MQIINIDFEKLLETREQCVPILRPQTEMYMPGEDIILSDMDSYTLPGERGVYYKKTATGEQTHAMPPKAYEVVTVYKEKIEKLESHLAYMLFGRNAEYVKKGFQQTYPQSDYFQIVVLKKR